MSLADWMKEEEIKEVIKIYQEVFDDIQDFNCGKQISKPDIQHIEEFAKNYMEKRRNELSSINK